MTTKRQTDANRRNALKSTGPVTPAGKARSRENALRHGLAGEGVVLSAAQSEAVQRRLDEWRDEFQIVTQEDRWLFESMVADSVRLDHCRHDHAVGSEYHARRASTCWDVDRQLEVEEVGQNLARKPALVSLRLENSAPGCDWLIDRWRELAEVLESGGSWTAAHHHKVSDLLGVPLENRDPSPAPDTPPGCPDSLSLAHEQIARLERRKEGGLDDMDDFQRSAAEEGFPVVLPRSLALIRRYEAACMARFQWARARLKRAEHPVAQPLPQPRPVAAPRSARESAPTQQQAPAQVPAPAAPRPSEPPPQSRPAVVPVAYSPLSAQFRDAVVSPTAAPKTGNRRTRRARERLAQNR